MEWKYWKVVLRYGHVGKRKDVTVARYLVTPSHYNLVMVMDIGKEMPGVKSEGVVRLTEVGLEEYLAGKRAETENFYLQQLFNYELRA
ncbi:hypothetical protein LZP85_09080 [Priestia flexa]|jgi:hypothetical protein|uniref:Uncharacterized protein n=2 Tax=Priestia TaxID=2800373 RepID=A0A0V8JI03_9BACI|nr:MULTISPECIES: hypothetical protein [Bacillaceae]AQX54791.1 hypothetical protein BC359_11065 [Priestia flexa]KSU86493.1 hypothetical protein AS180_18275 [Priestia veravalensis]KZB90464.1 hypothetical protein A2U94_15930 [Bacillus sp. VT 712]MBN8252039.1 hypothetical protein [Priestia flexa]MBN8434986.1 hypothetical protein [Priestia flexa]